MRIPVVGLSLPVAPSNSASSAPAAIVPRVPSALRARLLVRARAPRANYLMLWCFWLDTGWPFLVKRPRVHRIFALHHQVICTNSAAAMFRARDPAAIHLAAGFAPTLPPAVTSLNVGPCTDTFLNKRLWTMNSESGILVIVRIVSLPSHRQPSFRVLDQTDNLLKPYG